jgi:hypothetical protein
MAHLLGDGVDDAVEEVVLVDGAAGSALCAGPVVGNPHHDGVVQLSDLLQEVQDPAHLMVGKAGIAGVGLSETAEQPLLVIGEPVPGADHVVGRPRLAVRAGLVLVGVDGRQDGVLGRREAENDCR